MHEIYIHLKQDIIELFASLQAWLAEDFSQILEEFLELIRLQWKLSHKKCTVSSQYYLFQQNAMH